MGKVQSATTSVSTLVHTTHCVSLPDVMDMILADKRNNLYIHELYPSKVRSNAQFDGRSALDLITGIHCEHMDNMC